MSKEKRRIPKLRFPGFTEDWEQRKLGDVADVRDGTHDSPKFYNDGFPLVTSKNLKDGSIDFSDCSFISEQDFDEINKRSKVDPGDILFGMIGTIGKPAIVEYTSFAIKNVALIKEGNIINNRFIYHLLSSKVFDNYIARENAGGTQKFIALNQIRNFIFSAPTLAEQNKIIELLDYISQFITLHQRKLDNLKLKKKALLQKLFPKNGERYPELRFPGFTDAWEQRKLSEVTTCFDNLRVPVTASDRVPGKIPYYGANGIQDYVSGYTHSGEFVLIAEDGANDLNDYPIQYVNGAIWVNNHAHVIAGYKEKLENKFLSYSLKTVKMSTFIVGGGRSKLNLKALLEISISMPNYDEQCCIGKFIETIDKTITLHQRKLDHLQLQKKALLQQMFV